MATAVEHPGSARNGLCDAPDFIARDLRPLPRAESGAVVHEIGAVASNRLGRYWRDAHVALRHVTNVPMIACEMNGRDRLGMEPDSAPAGA